MIAFDTNLVVRLMVEDDERQAKVALSILDNAVEKSEKVLVTDIVLSELEWVLDSAYRVPRLRLLAAIQRLAADNRFVFEDQERLTNALARYQDEQAIFLTIYWDSRVGRLVLRRPTPSIECFEGKSRSPSSDVCLVR